MKSINSNRLTVTIGIPAYNEEQNIGNLLKSVFAQKEDGYLLNEIIVISDGSTDKTVYRAEKFLVNKRLKILDYSQRKGKAFRVNTLLKLLKSEVLITIDADSILKDEFVIKELIQPFKTKKNVGIVAGNLLPLKAKTFIESAINNYIIARNKFVDQFPYKKSAYIARGFLAYAKEVAKKIQFPEQLLNEDTYTFFYCITKGYPVYFQKNAVVLYRSPQTIRDTINQSYRHRLGGFQLREYYPADLIHEKFIIPKKINFKIMLYQLIHNPLGYFLLKGLTYYCINKAKKSTTKINTKWQRITTTKLLYYKSHA